MMLSLQRNLSYFLKKIPFIHHILKLCKKNVYSILKITPYLDILEEKIASLEKENHFFATQIKNLQNHFNNEHQKLTSQSLTLTESLYFEKSVTELQQRTLNYLTHLQNKNNLSTQKLLVSIVMPVWNREELVAKSIESVIKQTYAHWELFIIDSSTDQTKKYIDHYLKDSRIKYFFQKKCGQCAARNFGLNQCQGDIIAYLDSDNTWMSETLSIAVNAFLSEPTYQAINFAAIWHLHTQHKKYINFYEKINYNEAILHNNGELIGIDINCFMHRSHLYKKLGGFDTSLTGLEDYDYIFRYYRHTEIKPIPFIGTYYNFGLANNTLTEKENIWYNYYLIKNKYKTESASYPLKILYLIGSHPEDHSLLDIEINYMRKRGFNIDIWIKQNEGLYTSNIFRLNLNKLADVISKENPDLIHSHIPLNNNELLTIKKYDLKLTMAFHQYPDTLSLQFIHYDFIYHIYLFNNFLDRSSLSDSEKIKRLPIFFNPEYYYPKTKKNNLVLTVSYSLNQNLIFFLESAKICKNHQFLLVILKNQEPKSTQDITHYIQANHYPVNIKTDITLQEMALLTQKAGIYIHICDAIPASGMLLCNTMATGSYIISYDTPQTRHYLSTQGNYYDGCDQLTKYILATQNWSEEDWHFKQQQTLNRAYQFFVNERVLQTIINDWIQIKTLTTYS